MSSAPELAPEVPCASSYGRFTAAKEFWSQCYILLLFIIYICFGWIYLNYVIDTHIYTHKLGHLVDPQGPFGGILTYLQSQGRMQIFAKNVPEGFKSRFDTAKFQISSELSRNLPDLMKKV